MTVRKKLVRDRAWEGLVLGAALEVINAPDSASCLAAFRDLYLVRQVHQPRMAMVRLESSTIRALELGRQWVDAALWWDARRGTLRSKGQGPLPAFRRQGVKEEILEALEDVEGGSGYIYSGRRFELAIAEPYAPPHALMALALLPLFDEAAGWRQRLGRCRYRKCQQPFVVLTKRSGQEYCSAGHSNLERQYLFRERRRMAGVLART